MTKYTLSQKADFDLAEIYTYSYLHFGEEKADAYLLALEERFTHLADNPQLGRSVDHIRKNYLCYIFMQHAIYYRIENAGSIQVMRILHHRRDVKRNLN